MLWEVDVALRDAAGDHAAREVTTGAEALGIAACTRARTAAGWLLEGELSRADVERLATVLFADPVTEAPLVAELGAARLVEPLDGLPTVVLQLERQQLLLWEPLLDFRWYVTPAPAPSPSQAVAVNRADGEALAALPAMDPARCQRLLQERARSPFRDLADLQERSQLPPDVVERWIGRVSFPPPSAGPVLPPGVRRPGR
jgi:hypothetical protein